MNIFKIRKYNSDRTSYIETCVDDVNFKREYQQKGWEFVENTHKPIELTSNDYAIKEIKTEKAVIETKIAEKKKAVKHFDDKLVKEE